MLSSGLSWPYGLRWIAASVAQAEMSSAWATVTTNNATPMCVLLISSTMYLCVIHPRNWLRRMLFFFGCSATNKSIGMIMTKNERTSNEMRQAKRKQNIRRPRTHMQNQQKTKMGPPRQQNCRLIN